MAHKYCLLEYPTSEQLNQAVIMHLAEGWDLWGNPFVQESMYDGDVYDIHYFQAVVKFELSNHVEKELSEPAGFSVQLPETPACEERAGTGAPVENARPPVPPTAKDSRQLLWAILVSQKAARDGGRSHP